MKIRHLIRRTLMHYLGSSLATAAGLSVAAAILTGALIIGDSLSHSLYQIVDLRLGQVTHTITAGERLFGKNLAATIKHNEEMMTAPALKTEAVVSSQQTNVRLNKVQVWGVDEQFLELNRLSPGWNNMQEAEAVISRNLADRLQVDTGDFLLTRIRYTGPIPANTPFVSEADQIIPRRVQIKTIIEQHELARFGMQSSQTAPYNMFVDLSWLNRIMDLEGRANMVLIRDGADAGVTRLEEALAASWSLHDSGLDLAMLEEAQGMLLTSERVFVDDHVSQLVSEEFPDARQYLTYFVNSLISGDKETPYSFVTAGNDLFYNLDSGLPIFKYGQEAPDRTGPDPGVNLQRRALRTNETVINQWLADDLGAAVGDSLLMRFYQIGALRELTEKEAWFVVAGIMPMEYSKQDGWLMPHLPGLSDAGSCGEWEAGIPINLDAIRQKDEDYWDDYRGTPKAYISLERGQELWQNRFGNLTAIVFDNDMVDPTILSGKLADSIDPFRLSFQVNPVREQGMQAAGGGVDFAELFAGLGMFIIMAGLLLTWLLVSLNLNKRRDQIRLYASMGYSETLIRRILSGESLLIIIVGTMAGSLLAIAYSKLVFAGLNTLWHDIVRTDVLTIQVRALPMIAGALASIILGAVVMLLAINRSIRDSLSAANSPSRLKNRKLNLARLSGYAGTLFLGIAACLVGYAHATNHADNLLLWMIAGCALLAALLTLTANALYSDRKTKDSINSIGRLSLNNLKRNPLRSFTVIALLALGSFVIVVTASNRKDMGFDPDDKTSGTGGFAFMAETTAPVLRNLNTESTRLELGIPDSISFVQFHAVYDDDASCLNLNRVENPRLIATDPSQLHKRFTFTAKHSLLDDLEPWASLDTDLGGVIPGIADQTVIRWGLGKNIGDTLTYLNASGEEVPVLLIGGLANSIFQGNVIISANNLLTHFPTTSGSHVFLIDTKNNTDDIMVTEELAWIFRDHGWEMQETREKLTGFNTVENTYLAIFFLLGAFGMLLGTIGLAIIITKTMLERQKETALLRVLGFRISTISRLYISEYTILLFAGILSGALAALMATWPAFASQSQNISSPFLLGVMTLIVLNGLGWIICMTLFHTKKQDEVAILQKDR